MSKYKVLHLITHLDVGGAQDNTLLTVEALDRRHFEVHLAAAGGEWEARGRSVADRFFPVRSLKRAVFTHIHARAFSELFSLMRRERYHIVHTHSTHAGLLGRLAAQAAGVPVVIHTVHGFACDDLTLSPGVRAALVLMERLCARVTDRLIMVSSLNREQALRLGIAPPEKMVVIHSGIDMRRFHNGTGPHWTRARPGIEGGTPVVGWVGRLCPQNAPETFIAAARRIAAGRPEVRFVMAGDGPLWAQCCDLARDLPQVTLLGHVEDVPHLLPLFDAFVSTVRWAGLGRALTEAMIVGLPVVATRVNGVPEIVRHGETGLLVQPDDPEAITASVCFLLDHPDVATRLGRNARAWVVPEFGAELMVERIGRLYHELLAQKERRDRRPKVGALGERLRVQLRRRESER